MARLTSEKRKALPKSDFGMPGQRKYPMPDRSHAMDAKGRATQAVKAGRMTKAMAEKIDRKADRILGEKDDKAPRKRISGNTRVFAD